MTTHTNETADPEPVIHMDPEEARTPAPDENRDDIADAESGQELNWRGKKLHDLTASRWSLFNQHRLAMGAPPLNRCLADLDAFLADALRILWLCSHEAEDWQDLRRYPVDFERTIGEWADEVPRSTSLEAVRTAYLVYARGLPEE